jgi:hypothetical protein
MILGNPNNPLDVIKTIAYSVVAVVGFCIVAYLFICIMFPKRINQNPQHRKGGGHSGSDSFTDPINPFMSDAVDPGPDNFITESPEITEARGRWQREHSPIPVDLEFGIKVSPEKVSMPKYRN